MIVSEMNRFIRMCFSYTKRAQITADIYRDRLVPPMETALYWIEYVAATKGASHLHSIATHFHTVTTIIIIIE